MSQEHLSDKDIGNEVVYVNDKNIVKCVHKNQNLQNFLTARSIKVPPQCYLGKYHLFKFNKRSLFKAHKEEGRIPTAKEWNEVDQITQELNAYLDEDARRIFNAQQLPKWFSVSAWWWAGFAIVLFIASVAAHNNPIFTKYGVPFNVLILYINWLFVLGALGSAANIVFNAISLTDDSSFNVNNNRLLVLRLLVGGVFAMVLTLPFGFDSFLAFTNAIYKGNVAMNADGPIKNLGTQSTLLILPFILGYSTSLSIIILNRFLDAIKALFGVSENKEKHSTKSSRISPNT